MYPRTTTYKFKEVFASAEGSKRCEFCWKTMHRTFKRSQTINPYNKNPDGSLKTSSDIIAQEQPKAMQDAKDWEAKPEKCAACRKKDIPDIEIDMISEEDYEKIRQIMPALLQAQGIVNDCTKYIETTLKGKCLMVGGGRDQPEKLAKVDYTYVQGEDISVRYDIVRKDRKGVTGTSDSTRLKWKKPEDNGG